MRIFEYHMWPSRIGGTESEDNRLIAHLNSLGALGWRLVAVVNVGTHSHHYFIRVVDENRILLEESANEWASEGVTKQ